MNCKQQHLFQWTFCSLSVSISLAALILLYHAKSASNGAYVALILLIAIQIVYAALQFKLVSKPMEQLGLYLKELSQGRTPEITARDRAQFHLFAYVSRIANYYQSLDTFARGWSQSISETSASKKDLVAPRFLQSIKGIENYIQGLKAEAEDWKIKEAKRTWTNQGIAQFSDILRNSHASLAELSSDFLRKLISYISANQGGIFLIRTDIDQAPLLEMVACHAYDRERYPEKVRSLEDGLLGAVCYEKQSIYLTRLPENYMEIRSGLGDATPGSLLMVPLLHEKKVIGVIEVASFKEFDKEEIAFVEKIAEGLSSTIASAQINQTTSQLLAQSQDQSQELQRQEEELRQNIEEMKSQQEEMEQKKIEVEEHKVLMSKIIDLVPYPIFVKNKNRQYIVANQAQAKLFNLNVELLLGKSDNDLISSLDELGEILESDNKVLKENQVIKLPEQTITLPSGESKIMQTIKVPFENNITKNINILGVSIDYTEQRLLEQKLKESQQEIQLMAQHD